MRNRFLKASSLLGFAGILLTVCAMPARAHIISTATVTPGCTSYTITVTGKFVSGPDTVNYTITLTPSAGSPITVTDSIAVFGDASGNFSATQTNSIGPLSGDFTLSGTATLMGSNTVNIRFLDGNS